MRKFQKNELIKLVGLLGQVNDTIKVLIDKKNYDKALSMLADCQQNAIRMGGIIEASEPSPAKIIQCLEDYCETLYNVSQSMTTSLNSNCEYKLLKKRLNRVEQGIRDGIPVKKEVVFLPYKASMWDSLESVWMAAKDDVECECYVIPIPYFNRNQDGELGEINFEAGQMPEYVPITSYKEYDISVNKPDVIYIHNSYDQYNLVTSVHPAYYSLELKKHTDMLVYIPYFVCVENVLAHFCTTSGIFNADKVIVQSNKIKQKYIQEFVNVCINSEKQITNCVDKNYKELVGKIAREKFIVLGSPKIDKTIICEDDKPDFPREWIQTIRKKNQWKENDDIHDLKLVLYNTHIDGIIKNGDVFLEKLRTVFEIFENRQDAVLLWRPHPLSEQTIYSIRPQLLEAYNKLKREYKEKYLGIYDDSADVNRAIALSDAYYGDWSSLVAMYGVTGKAIIIQLSLIHI